MRRMRDVTPHKISIVFKRATVCREKSKERVMLKPFWAWKETIVEMFQRLELTREDHVRLFDYAAQRGIEIFSTPFDQKSDGVIGGCRVAHFIS